MTDILRILKESISDRRKQLLFPYLPFPEATRSDTVHLDATIKWIEQSVLNGKGGSSSHYDLLKGAWRDPFPETTGYLIPTLYDYAHFSCDRKYSEIATRLTEWLAGVQLPNGGCIQGNYHPGKKKQEAIIFNTGQNIFGFLRAYRETGNQVFLDSALKAGNLLVSSVDEHKTWNTNLHRGMRHTINTRTSWSLLELYQVKPDPVYKEVALKNLDWAVQQQTANGWFKNGTSRPGGLPNTHFLSYTCEGLIQSYRLVKEPSYLDAAKRTADKMFRIFESRKMLYAFWDENWKNRGKYMKNSKGRFVCLTGNIQISMVWMWLFEETHDFRYLNAAFKMLDFVKTTQNLASSNPGIFGGIKGSFPIYGDYSSLKYPNWAAKFFVDALLMKIYHTERLNEDRYSITLPSD